MGITISLKGGDLTNKVLDHLKRQLSKASSVEVGWNSDATYPDNHRNGGDYVANIAVINEFGGTIREHTQNIYRSISANGEFRQGARFVKSGRSNYQTSNVVEEYTIPARPFFRTMIAAKKGTYGADLDKALRENDYDSKKALGLVGYKIQLELSKTIGEWATPPNAPITIARKGFDDPLHESGLMGSTVMHRVE